MPEAGAGLALVGLPGSGKTTVGRLLAERRGVPFRDTDQLIERRVGVPAAAYLRERGEDAFRAAERQAIAEACAIPGAVVATGGGALDDPLNRWRLWSHGRAVWLRAAEPTLLARLAADRMPRPLLDPDPAARLRALALRRDPCYRAADLASDAGGSPEHVVDEIARALAAPQPPGRRLYDARTPRGHPVGPVEARVLFGTDLGAALDVVLAEIGGRPWAVVDGRAPRALARHVAPRLELRGGERIKRLRHVAQIGDWLSAQGAERGDPLVGVGGGTLTDLAGTAAALYARGIPFVAVPTTWLGQADAALGGKVAVDLPGAKNMVGAFWPAWAVVADTTALRTLSPARLRDGMAEAIKSAIIGDPVLWDLLEERGTDALVDDEAARYAITERAARVKLAIVARDPFERGERRLLNLGHTVGHALEVASGYRLPHGAAVALGLRAAARLAAGRGGDPSLGAALDELLHRLGYRLHRRVEAGAVRRAMATDKKRAGGRQRWLLPLRIGEVMEADDLTDAEVMAALQAIGEG